MVMKKLSEHPDFQDGFLDPDEGNIKALTESVEVFFDASREAGSTGRRPRDPVNYDKILEHAEFPTEGQDRETVAQDLGEMFGGVPRFHHPNAAFNIIPPPFFDGVAARVLTSVFRPNAASDRVGGNGVAAERWVTASLGKGLFGTEKPAGFSTPGGASTLMYGIKSGMTKAKPNHKEAGVGAHEFAVLSSNRSHFSIETTLDYLGLGTDSWKKIETSTIGEMDMDDFERVLDAELSAGTKIAAAIGTCGTTIDLCIDDIKEMRDICDRMEQKHNLDYKIHIHADAVAGWAYCFANDNDLLGNDVGSYRIRQAKERLEGIKHADTAGVDFHKTFIASYVTSFFVGRDVETISGLGNTARNPFVHLEPNTVQMCQITAENSRPFDGVATAFTLMNRLGTNGVTEYLKSRQTVRSELEDMIDTQFPNNFEILNDHSNGFEIIMRARNDSGVPFETADYQALSEIMLAGGEDIPMIGFVPEYLNPETEEKEPALLIYPMSPHADTEACYHLLSRIRDLVNTIDVGHNGHLDNGFVPMR